MAFRQMLEYDALRGRNLEEDAVVRIVCPVGPVHDEAPGAARPKLEGLESAREPVRAPPPSEVFRLGKCPEDALARSIDDPGVNELAVGRGFMCH
jgi:hypothetical protein